ncbi:hypothetical protein CBR_g23256 [Chara braunii]|uniref:Uncharacterized protein n=1 Tax=Chara braunii TaxID=69332 RepID=A0A388JVB5_CHABU|nr:hypothetical protein CBR_g23256 [Chara braunii]|eukprot:GBG61741.1 hypothetical protein CBR_g23256 [Chara braunii]
MHQVCITPACRSWLNQHLAAQEVELQRRERIVHELRAENEELRKGKLHGQDRSPLNRKTTHVSADEHVQWRGVCSPNSVLNIDRSDARHDFDDKEPQGKYLGAQLDSNQGPVKGINVKENLRNPPSQTAAGNVELPSASMMAHDLPHFDSQEAEGARTHHEVLPGVEKPSALSKHDGWIQEIAGESSDKQLQSVKGSHSMGGQALEMVREDSATGRMQAAEVVSGTGTAVISTGMMHSDSREHLPPPLRSSRDLSSSLRDVGMPSTRPWTSNAVMQSVKDRKYPASPYSQVVPKTPNPRKKRGKKNAELPSGLMQKLHTSGSIQHSEQARMTTEECKRGHVSTELEYTGGVAGVGGVALNKLGEEVGGDATRTELRPRSFALEMMEQDFVLDSSAIGNWSGSSAEAGPPIPQRLSGTLSERYTGMVDHIEGCFPHTMRIVSDFFANRVVESDRPVQGEMDGSDAAQDLRTTGVVTSADAATESVDGTKTNGGGVEVVVIRGGLLHDDTVLHSDVLGTSTVEGSKGNAADAKMAEVTVDNMARRTMEDSGLNQRSHDSETIPDIPKSQKELEEGGKGDHGGRGLYNEDSTAVARYQVHSAYSKKNERASIPLCLSSMFKSLTLSPKVHEKGAVKPPHSRSIRLTGQSQTSNFIYLSENSGPGRTSRPWMVHQFLQCMAAANVILQRVGKVKTGTFVHMAQNGQLLCSCKFPGAYFLEMKGQVLWKGKVALILSDSCSVDDSPQAESEEAAEHDSFKNQRSSSGAAVVSETYPTQIG